MTDKKYSLTGYYKETNEELWLWDDLPELEMEVGYKVGALLHYEQSPFQEISIIETKGFGRMLVLDGTPQVTEKDGFIYNEMITHITMTTHHEPQKVAMIGGGDCGPAREALKYDSVQQIDVVDRSDPYGPATSLYKQQFYQYVYDSLTADGIAVFQSGSPYYNQNILKNTISKLKKLFPIVRTYLCSIPSFPGGIWSFTVASKKWDPLEADLNGLQWQETKYISPEIFRASFTMPNYIKKILEEK
jgi:spermidine synthase